MTPEGDNGNEVDRLRAGIDDARRDIDRTLSELESRLDPERLRLMMAERLRRVSGPWRQEPAEQLEVLGRETMTRIREMAWMNPVGLGLTAAVVGYLLGRRADPS